jgi:hypothetical protein
MLITRKPVDLNALPPGLRIGTSSPRRAAQIRRRAPVTVLPIRGNVPTRIAKLSDGQFDAVILAAAGLARLGLCLTNSIDLPLLEFVPAPAQGALAVQVREGSEAVEARLDHRGCLRAWPQTPNGPSSPPPGPVVTCLLQPMRPFPRQAQSTCWLSYSLRMGPKWCVAEQQAETPPALGLTWPKV